MKYIPTIFFLIATITISVWHQASVNQHNYDTQWWTNYNQTVLQNQLDDWIARAKCIKKYGEFTDITEDSFTLGCKTRLAPQPNGKNLFSEIGTSSEYLITITPPGYEYFEISWDNSSTSQ